jgi:hypothetical protein
LLDQVWTVGSLVDFVAAAASASRVNDIVEFAWKIWPCRRWVASICAGPMIQICGKSMPEQGGILYVTGALSGCAH